MPFFKSSRTPLIGVDIGSTVVKLLALERSGDKYRIESYSVEPLPPDSVTERNITNVELVGEAISRALKKSESRLKHAACAVSGSAVITKVITMRSDLSEEEMESQIQLEAHQYIPYPLEEVNLDFQILGASESGPDSVDVLLAASRSDNVELRVAALEIGGLKAKVVDVEVFALENAVRFMLEKSGEDSSGIIAVLDVGATTTNLSVLKNMRTIYTREQRFGGKLLTEEIQRRYSLSYPEAGFAKRHGGLPEDYETDVLWPFKKTMVMEVNRALQFFQSSGHAGKLDRIILSGGCASIVGIGELLETKTNVPVTIANPFLDIGISSKVRADVIDNDKPSLMIAFGLALRGVE